MAPKMGLSTVDFVVIAAYFVGVLAVGIWVSKVRHNKTQQSGRLVSLIFITIQYNSVPPPHVRSTDLRNKNLISDR